jgi:chaperone BCS1
MLNALKTLVGQNQFLAGGLVLGIIAGMLASLKKAPAYLFNKVKDWLLISVEIQENDPPYAWVMRWLSLHPKNHKFKSVTSLVRWKTGDRDGKSVPEIAFVPSGGLYFFAFSGTPVWIKIHKKDKFLEGFELGEKRTLTLLKMGKSKAALDALLQAAYKAYCPDEFTSIKVYHYLSSYWTNYHSVSTRSRETLVYDGEIIDGILADAERFVARREWYMQMGIPYRRGYLFHGEPGNGKTSLAMLLATKLHLNICLLNVTSLDSDVELNKAMISLPQNSLLMLEDIDAAFVHRAGVNNKKEETGVTFSGLLNALDGIAAGEGRILVMTTNHLDRLDDALIRAGRCDVRQYIGNASHGQVREMFKRFYPDSSLDQRERFTLAKKPGTLSMSRIQEILLGSTDPEDACRKIVAKEVSLKIEAA